VRPLQDTGSHHASVLIDWNYARPLPEVVRESPCPPGERVISLPLGRSQTAIW